MVEPVARAGHDDGYLDGARVTWDENDRGLGPIGTAIRTGQPCPIQNIAADARFTPWRDEATKRGYASVCGLPLIAGGRVLGALGVYSSEPDAFNPEEVALLNELAGDLAFGVVTLRTRAGRARAEETLRASEERFRQLALNSSDIVTVMGASDMLVYVGGAVERILGYTPDELLGSSGFELVHPDDVDDARRVFAEIARRPGAGGRLEYRHRHKGGDWVWLEAVGRNLLEDATVHGIVMNVRDVTERKHAEDERKALQNQLQQAMKMEAVGRLAGGGRA
jgi:PAS domain S-box-containing protein